MSPIVPRWEWRSFAHAFPRADAAIDALTPVSTEDSEELYLLAPGGDNVKIRDGLLDIKVLRETDGDGLQRWEPVLKAAFPLDAAATRAAFEGLGLTVPDLVGDGSTLDGLLGAVTETSGATGDDDAVQRAVRPVRVRKHRVRYEIGGCQAERSTMEVDGQRTATIAVESPDAAAVVAAVRSLGLGDYRNLDVPSGLRFLADRAPERYAVIDAGTNSVKFHVAELDADGVGPWRVVVDRAEITRLGEGLEASGEIGPAPAERTASAIAGMADEARSLDVRAIAAVATAGWRMARNRDAVVAAVRERSGVALEVISGEDEGRLAYLAVAEGVGLVDGAIVVFDTGGGSSQFTFGRGTTVEERFSVNVGAVRFTERFGLAGAVGADVIDATCAAIRADLGRLEGREPPDVIVGMGGAVTNLAAVKHGLATFDGDVIQGTVLGRSEIDRQIERYRATDAEGRRTIVGLQPARAEVILAGACIVRTIMDLLGCGGITVSDHGLRHGVLIERFGTGGDVGGGG